MRIGICNDHAGVELKGAISALLRELGHEVVDFGCFTSESVDYPDFAHKLGRAVAAGGGCEPEAACVGSGASCVGSAAGSAGVVSGGSAGAVDCGIAICGTGNGMAITLNHHHGVRAGLAWSPEIAELVKRHNNANVLVLSARFVSEEVNLECVRTWLGAQFEGGRHACRISKIESSC